MLGARHNLEIFDSVIGSVSIEVMDMLSWKKLPTEMLFHYNTMLSHTVKFIPDSTVALFVNPTLGIFDSVATFGMPVGITMPIKSGVMHLAHPGSKRGLIATFKITNFHWNLLEDNAVAEAKSQV